MGDALSLGTAAISQSVVLPAGAHVQFSAAINPAIAPDTTNGVALVVDGLTFACDAGKRFGTDVGAFGAHIAVARADHKTFFDAGAEVIREDGVVR